jgi:predicted Zn finger-like uncharacterized protein
VKFLCEQCKAKYQIADDKVAGKTVRMKCRKCGFMIEVRAEVTETSVAQGLPEDPKKPAGKPSPLGKSLATSLTGRPPPPKGKPDALAGAFQRKVRQDGPPESTASLEMLDSSATSGWYVAINGVPVGPIRISELRRKAANGAVTEDSLVWREGLEEWRPVRSVTELAEIVREAMTSGRPSLVTPPPNEARQSYPPPPAGGPRPPARPLPPPPREPPARPAPLAARSNVVPFTGRLATAEKREEEEDIDLEEVEGSEPKPLPAPTPPPAAMGAAAAGLPERPSMVNADPFALPPAVAGAPAAMMGAPMAGGAAFSSASASAPLAPAAMAPPQVGTEQAATAKRPPNYIAIGMVLAFVGFGITGGIVAFRQPAQPQQPTIIQVPVPMQQQGVATAQAPQETPEISLDTPETTQGKTGKSGGGSRPSSKQPTEAAKPLGIDLGTERGPGINPGAGPGPSALTALTSDQVQTTVRNYSTGVKRTCWERANAQIASVKIDAKVTVAANGSVQSVDANGNEPAVAKCIESQVRNWHFPASNGSTTVNIPFVFVRQ